MHTRAFDQIANEYDESFTDTGVGRALRDIVWARLEQHFRPGQRILELGCGTGEDATHLAQGGVRVVATDPSSRMIQVARNKAGSRGCEAFIDFHCVEMEKLGPSLDGARFDGVLSNFGALNCAQRLPELVADIAARVNPGAALVWVVMGRTVPWEWLWFLARGQWRKAWRRYQGNGTQWRGMTIAYLTPSELKEMLQPYFRVTRLAALGVVLPPSYASGWLEGMPRVLAMLTWLERQAQRLPWLSSVSDHFIVEATRL